MMKYDTVPLWQEAVYENGFPINKGSAPIWSNYKQNPIGDPPAVGTMVHIRMNGLGAAKVVGYFTEDKYLGVRVVLQSPPDWWKKQNADRIANGEVESYVFGSEISPIK